MSQRLEFVLLAMQRGVNFRELCRRFRVSAKTGYKWRQRYVPGETATLSDRSRRPRRSPEQYAGTVVNELLELYQQWGWGGRKLRRRLLDLGRTPVPAASTCTAILRRAGAYAGHPEAAPGPCQRFVRGQPNELWQMDFKGDFATQAGARCYPLTVLDDHSRFNLVLEAAANRTGSTVQHALVDAFATYGVPEAILCDNGPPWGCAEPVCPYTTFTVWLLQLGVSVLHGRPYHPQTQGKDERFHRTLGRELVSRHTWRDLRHCAQEFPSYRQRYNCERPHDSLEGDTPVRHYQPSPRRLPAALPPIEYAAGTTVRLVRTFGGFSLGNQTWYVGRAFAGLPIGLRPSPQADGQWQVWFAHHLLGTLDLTLPTAPKHKLRSIYQPST
jgi:transposase InsO family protein